MATNLAVEKRNTEKRSFLTELRSKGHVPANLYGYGTESVALSVDEPEFIKAYREVGRNGVLKLNVDGKDYSVMVQEMQVHPLKNAVTHIDFIAIDLNKETEAEVPVVLTGDSAGVKEGGVLQRVHATVNVKALPSDFPEQLEASIEDLNIGDSLYVKDLPTSGKYEILHEEDEVIASVVPPKLQDEETDPDTEEADEAGDAPESSESVGDDVADGQEEGKTNE
ncbi:50S ribosomal protein L25/general stress protein Ctc [Fictibacillus phosphorivorans]|uniref:50S ribosomal protein L25/general stress protein Ctc n=1 Tax=Fictibacillus phosphorivorans TaxID=1221500 RepID=UPI00203AF064|nr:50S ribosomal protein L25/general stress protein Ctc [Fictibacillus phosphorivorans]MCM3719878.1 50S ribosomal protein L25/general stress protein Ctc [Fictibacillus phosphorivorans]MCM3777568.1 50S ribosomal protein L25/general stress protein Ctc [Fictibacillus phosphorivorans]